MIKNNWKILLITSITILLPILAGLILWDQLPEQIPLHWNMEGEIDDYSSKSFAVFGLPLILLAFHLFTFFVTLSDPKNQNLSDKVLHLIFWIIPVMSVGLSAITYSVAMGKDVRVEVVISVSLGLLFLVIGNYLPKCKQSYTIGIKLPWTLHSEENWNRTHRLAGWIWAIGGFMILIAGFFGVFILTMTIPLIMALIPIVYSYLLHRKGI
jgi:uncharacterized membrane protein